MKGHLKDHWQLWIIMAAILLAIGALLRTVAIDLGLSDFNANIVFRSCIGLLLVLYLTCQEVVSSLLRRKFDKWLRIKKKEDVPVIVEDDDFPPIEEPIPVQTWEINEISIDDVEFADEEETQDNDAPSMPSDSINEEPAKDCIVINVTEIREKAKQAAADKHSALAKRVYSYVHYVMLPYVENDSEMERLIDLIAQFFEFPSTPTFSVNDTIKVSPELKPIDLMHLGWNIGRAFKKKIEFTAIFLKHVFPDVFNSMETTTIEKKIKCDPSKGIIPIKDDVKNFDLDEAIREAEDKRIAAEKQEERIKNKPITIPKEKPKENIKQKADFSPRPKLSAQQSALKDMVDMGMFDVPDPWEPGDELYEDPDEFGYVG